MKQVIRNILSQLVNSPKQVLLSSNLKILSNFLQSQENKLLHLLMEATKIMGITAIPIIIHQTKNRLNKIMGPNKIHLEFQR